MKKAVLVVDMPSSCKECNLQQFYICKPVKKSVVGTPTYLKSKPDWCPLRELPSKYAEKDFTPIKDERYDNGYEDGYNACIDELLRGEEG